VDASGPDDVWAAGQIRHSREFRAESLLEHWDGTSWRAVSCPNVGELSGVAVAAPGDVWALSGNALLHWRDGRCDRITAPRVGGDMAMLSIAAAGPRSIWICGVRPGTHYPATNFTAWNTLVARWNGESWHVYQTPNLTKQSNYLRRIVALSPTNIWAGGSSLTKNHVNRNLVIHWNGDTWQIVDTPDPGKTANGLWGIGSDRRHIWALSAYSNGRGDRQISLPMRRAASAWITTQVPADRRLHTISALSGVAPDDVWAVGGWPNEDFTLIHFNGHSWTTDPASTTTLAQHSTLTDVVAISPTDAWTVGVTSGTKKLGERPLIEHWDGKHWTSSTLTIP
jgi:hypothetical protein